VSLGLCSQCWGGDTCFGEYQDFENLSYPGHIHNYFVISDSCFGGRKSGLFQLSGEPQYLANA
jgi:hypothetical protein